MSFQVKMDEIGILMMNELRKQSKEEGIM